MDILKRAYGNIHQCRVIEDRVEVCGKTYHGDTSVNFPTRKSKQYNLSSVIFYLMNSNTPLAEYVERCQKNKIIPVSYIDHSSIKEDINNFKDFEIPGFFIQPSYMTNKAYEIPEVRKYYRILVPNGISSLINIRNISKLLSTGEFERVEAEPFSNITVELSIENLHFKISNNHEDLTEDDWSCMKAVFLDDSEYMASSIDIPKLIKTSAIFTLREKPFKHTKLIIDDNYLKNFENVLSEIKSKIFN